MLGNLMFIASPRVCGEYKFNVLGIKLYAEFRDI